MLIYFEMISENMNINFKVFGKKEGNLLIFPDKSTPNTMINVTIGDNEIVIERTGNVNMKQVFKLKEKMEGYYKNNLGLEFKTASFTKELYVRENSINVLYEHYFENEWQSSNKLKIIF